MWLVLAYNEITILKSSYGTLGRPMHSKENTSHGPWFWLLEMVILFKFLVKNINKSTLLHLQMYRMQFFLLTLV